jgi:hypothetical protein
MKSLYIINKYYEVGSSGAWNQSLAFAKQELYYLSHTPAQRILIQMWKNVYQSILNTPM